MKKFELYEDNGGGLHLFLLNNEGRAIAGYGNWEYGPQGNLKEAIAEIDEYEQWGGDYGGDIELPQKVVATNTNPNSDHYGEPTEWAETTVDDLYREICGDRTSEQIAWSNGKDIFYCSRQRMGYAAKKALGLEEEDDE